MEQDRFRGETPEDWIKWVRAEQNPLHPNYVKRRSSEPGAQVHSGATRSESDPTLLDVESIAKMGETVASQNSRPALARKRLAASKEANEMMNRIKILS